jgi:pyroglutamyl-peptidase
VDQLAKSTRQSKVALLTGFDPFGGDAVNPSWEAVRRLRGARIAGYAIAVARIPTGFERCGAALAQAIARHRPELVLCVGLAAGRSAISLERIAINLIDARIPDNDSAQPIDVPVIAGAPAAYFTRLPVKAIVLALRRMGTPAEASLSAGTFVCNALAFHLAHHIATRAPKLRGGFVHVPATPELAADKPGVPSMALDTIVDALRECVRVAATARRDSRRSEGRTH